MRNTCVCVLAMVLAVGISPPSRAEVFELQTYGNGHLLTVGVILNGVVATRAILDTGCSDVSLPEETVLALVRAHTIAESDVMPDQTYSMADGRRVTQHRFLLKTLRMGNKEFRNVVVSVAPRGSAALLGQDILLRFKDYMVSNKNKRLAISD
jgi:predicted aspartyl protease